MKLRNLMYATMIACAFASCSKDDVTTPGGKGTDAGLGDAKMSVAIALADPSTKAESDGNALTGETQINNVQVGIYQNGVLIADAAKENADGNSIEFTGLPANVDLVCIVLANIPSSDVAVASISPGSLDKTLSVKTAGFSSSALPMYAKSTPFVLNPGDNATKNVKVFRNVARIQVSGIILDMAHNLSPYQKGNASFALKSISVNDVAEKALVTGDYLEAGNTYVHGFAGYRPGTASFGYYFKDGFAAPNFTLTQSFDKAQSTEPVSMTGLGTAKAPVNYFYVFANESTDNQTVLTIAGEYTLTGAETADHTSVPDITEGTISYYPVTIGLSGVEGGTAKVAKNMVYDIALTIAGPGYTTPGPDPSGKTANFTVVATAADWSGIVNQAPVIP